MLLHRPVRALRIYQRAWILKATETIIPPFSSFLTNIVSVTQSNNLTVPIPAPVLGTTLAEVRRWHPICTADSNVEGLVKSLSCGRPHLNAAMNPNAIELCCSQTQLPRTAVWPLLHFCEAHVKCGVIKIMAAVHKF